MRKILITGGTGLVGKALNNISTNYNYTFTFLSSKDCDLTNFNQTKQLFHKIQPDFVIHLAANVGGLYKNMNYKTQILEDNLLINYNVIKCCHDFKIKKCISILSTCIYPDKINYPIKEEDLHNGPPHNSNDAYAYSKRILEIHCKNYNEQYNDNFICLIPTNIYGENDNFHLEKSHVIPGLIHKCYLSFINNTDFIIKGTGKPLRQFIYSKDLAILIMWFIENYNSKENIILAPPENKEISIKNLSEIILHYFYKNINSNKNINIKFDTTFSDGQYKKTVSNNKFNNFYPDFKFTDINLGIDNTIKWFLNNYPNIRQ